MLALGTIARASTPAVFAEAHLAEAFKGAQTVDLAKSKVPSAVKLREVVGLPPPEETVYVKTFKRETLPGVLKPAFARKGVVGVTINARYIAILHTPLAKEHEDVLAHELVHAYITLTAPRPLPFWFQEASAVHFSTDKGKKFYGQPSKTKRWVMEGRVVELTPTYKQKLQSFHFLIEQVGKKRFYEWYKQAVLTGGTDARPLLGLGPQDSSEKPGFTKPFPVWMAAVMVAVVVAIAVVGYYASRRGGDYY